MDEASVRRGLKKVGYVRNRVPLDATDYIDMELSLVHVGPAIVVADMHMPLFDPVLTNRVIDVAEETGIKSLVLAGDTFNFDALSRFEPKQQNADLLNELTITVAVARVLLETFDEIYVLKGNHDFRVVKALGFQLQFKHAMRLVFGDLGEQLISRLRFTNLDHMWIKPYEWASPFDSWYVCHPMSYTQQALSKTRVLSDKYNANVITAHSHHFAQGWARDGRRIVAEAGGLFDPSKTEYLQATTTFPTWAQGFFWLESANKGNSLGLRSLPELWVPKGI